ncbi:MAG: LD-carboxypeptidase [Thermomicrobiales bacterium]|nr:LD-carboxypeptidase [Thermomicrobiales bacterium]
MSPTPLKYPALKPEGCFGIVSPSWFGGETFIPRAMHGIRYMESLGYSVKIAPHAFKNRGHVSDTAINRAADINTMFADPDVNAIMCTIGGTHSIDVIPYLDFDLIRANPKPFIGYSDITSLNVAIHAMTGLCTINGPYLLSDWAEFPQMPEISQDWMLKLLTSSDAPGEVPYPDEWTREFLDWETGEDRTRRRHHERNTGRNILNAGQSEGTLIGGCLECLNLLWGTRYWPNLDGAILFIETAGDLKSAYATDELMGGLELTGALDRIAGLLFAKPYDFPEENWGILERLLRERLDRYDFPVITNMDFGHYSPTIAMPLGVQARIDTEMVAVTLLESPAE